MKDGRQPTPRACSGNLGAMDWSTRTLERPVFLGSQRMEWVRPPLVGAKSAEPLAPTSFPTWLALNAVCTAPRCQAIERKMSGPARLLRVAQLGQNCGARLMPTGGRA